MGLNYLRTIGNKESLWHLVKVKVQVIPSHAITGTEQVAELQHYSRLISALNCGGFYIYWAHKHESNLKQNNY
jgi:hypothetical protein